ncbi:type II toxin-antitoxin system RelE/ParE family toxin [Xanthomonas euvesicatoria]|uniref:type II toxin-antitoxin system RelE/ParE family toxin n=1 Tax=Xanthomonas euvesicatoria TaxID=456327 RepID=UPI001E3CD1E1|nr:type II toxin-antitoxin system RelE/ParE family toxin [Xanthomonas euvesicatoria]
MARLSQRCRDNFRTCPLYPNRYDDNRETQAPVQGRGLEEGLQGVPRPPAERHGRVLFVVQLGGTPDAAKPWKGLGSGVYELVEDHRGDTFRAVYMVWVGDAVHVLHALHKKSKSDTATPPHRSRTWS